MPQDWLNIGWKILMLRGVIAIIFGFIAILAPITAAIAFVLLWGIWALADGIGSLVQAFQKDGPDQGAKSRWLHIAMGVISLAAAFVAITSPGLTAVTLTWILGIWLLIRGVFELAGAFRATVVGPRWLLFLGAALDLFLGVMFILNPGRSAVAIALVLGITAVAWGAVFLAAGFLMRKEAKAGSREVTVS